ncbi:putative proteinD(P)-BINDING ROSSMANN-FOLD SUPERFAMILY PROTEIN [Salix koriyanagi]|uniref:NAD(P)-binding domain-containing protein n=1 Tax=Salix koriyanagi TaxID=2511006 RepID=A0A9Q1AFT4_9ROSI|nr:putative proteinD(P)-BINDING ROSSMANN-FOLD SUPERFAMILY PROTEIN [Salix koriyanagi]
MYMMAIYSLNLDCRHKADRGAHTYWLEKGTVEFRPDHILNLIHYEDAASLAVAILKKKLEPDSLGLQEVMDLVAKSGKFSKKFVAFTGTSDPLGKRLNNSKTREEIGWEPKYLSFALFFSVSQNRCNAYQQEVRGVMAQS